MAKRSPILGYNHNIRYRGLVFHVQTEDSGVLSPHLFTHLFREGVIISTRKLLYDSGSDEGAIKSLMQAQHKAVMKDLKRGHFDDKIDQYLGGTEGLLPRGVVDANASPGDSQPVAVPSGAMPAAPPADVGLLSEPEITFLPGSSAAIEPPPVPARTQTAERASKGRVGPPPVPPPPSADLDAPTIADSAPEIHIEALEPDLDDGTDAAGRRRTPRDTDVAAPDEVPAQISGGVSDGVPGPLGGATTRTETPRPPQNRAATLPPARPVTRPPRPAMTPQQVLSRPLTNTGGEERGRRDSDAVEVYAPAQSGAQAPPGEVSGDRPGVYAQHKRSTGRIEVIKERPGSAPIPSGLGRPGRSPSTAPMTAPPARPPKSPSQPPAPSSGGIPQIRSGDASGSGRPRPPTPARMGSSGPAARTKSQQNNSGVVMTRPAVIVGAPAKPPPVPRVRKAREDEGRGFGQGLISEKSLDEVILAYLSEDAEDK